MRRVVEGMDHVGDVAQGRMLEPALADRPGRLTLEVDNPKLLAIVKHLAEMEIAVATGAQGCNGPFVNGAEQLENVGLKPEHAFGLDLHVLGQAAEVLTQKLETLPRFIPHRLEQATLMIGCEWLRNEVSIFNLRRQFDVQGRGALAENSRHLEIGTDHV